MRDTRPPFPHAFRPCRGPRRSRESPCADAPRRWRAAPHLLSVNPPAARSGRRRAWRTCARPSRGRSGSQTRRRRDRHAGTRILPEQELVRSAATPSKVAPCTWARGAFAVRAQRCVGDVCSRTVQRGARAQSQSAALHIGGTAESSARTGARASRLGPRGAPRDCPPRRAGTAESPGPVESEASAVGAAVATLCLARRRRAGAGEIHAHARCVRTQTEVRCVMQGVCVHSRRGREAQRLQHDRWRPKASAGGDQSAAVRSQRIQR